MEDVEAKVDSESESTELCEAVGESEKLEPGSKERDACNEDITESCEDAIASETMEAPSNECDPTKHETVNDSPAATEEETNVVPEEKKPENMEIENLRKEDAELKELCENLTKECEEVGENLSSPAKQCSDLASKCDNHEQEIQTLRLEVEQSRSKYSELEKTSVEVQQQNGELQQRVQELQERVVTLETENRTLKEQLDSKAGVLDVDGSQVPDRKGELTDERQPVAAEQIQETQAELEQENVLVDSIPKAEQNAMIKEEEEEANRETPQPVAAPRKPPPLSSTVPMPFKRHSLPSGAHPLRSRSFDHSKDSLERRSSFGSDASGDSNPEVGNTSGPKFLKKKLSASHMDALKPRPFYKSGSQAWGDRDRDRESGSSKADSAGSASDSESAKEVSLEQESDTSAEQPKLGDETVDSSAQPADNTTPPSEPKEGKPPAPKTKPKPKPRKATEGLPHSDFKSGFSYAEYMSGIRGVAVEEKEESVMRNGDVREDEKQPEANEAVQSSADKGELV